MHLFYTPILHEQTVILPEEESKHAIKVLRLVKGNFVNLVDGSGGFYKATIEQDNPKKCVLRIVETVKQFGYRPFHIHVAVAPTKNIDRIEWFLEKATEIGVNQISFLLCERSERKQVNLDRLEKVVVSAMKQSVKAYKPVLTDIIPFKEFIKNIQPDNTYIAHLEEHDRTPLHRINLRDSACVLIGPEGDFSPAEIKLAYEKNIKPITLGNSRLRTETAALVACHTLNLLYEMKIA
ncbi:16S rRNA (uracil(1498)-N(3))-methyltransferase [Adhaeribacter rhizoryzae]|uniref:Ribosomal RNA small subunit methyltransferase E n=1 Tax=Adhaeribacter rhizoryzae TaxID=2607907 RepID=A0A5M6DRA5_9BACT|nr:16S rRNA (uracil(1498)-N(3))-methyltransferase [Adhaeribacter rhizoryzae]KAA5547945.1 16S rRNA (uracil(1498)-N(3))-methyltransferase [Adhaeribacter rhizoryzae]